MIKLNNRLFVILFVSLFTVSSITLYSSVILAYNNEDSHNKSSLSALTPHERIIISNDGNFTDYGFSGTGSSSSPYIIENYLIVTTESTGIYVTGTTKSFEIRNCVINANSGGIYIYQVASDTVKITSNTCYNHSINGITIRESDSASVSENTCYDNEIGIYIYESDYAIVSENTCSNNIDGIGVVYSTGSSVTGNTCENNEYNGIGEYYSSTTTFKNNICSNNGEEGLVTVSSEFSEIRENTFSRNQDGTVLVSADSEIINNTFFENSAYGVFLEGPSMDNKVHHNNFSWLTPLMFQERFQYVFSWVLFP